MISVTVRTNTTRQTLSVDATKKIAEVFDELGVNVGGSFVNLDGTPLNASDFANSFADMGIQDGSTCSLSSITKLDGNM